MKNYCKETTDVIGVISEELKVAGGNHIEPKAALRSRFEITLSETRLLPGWNRDMEICIKEEIVKFVNALIDYA